MGRGSAVESWVVVGVLVAVHCCSLLASSATLVVGDAQGWTIGPNYATWAAAHSFATGDVLLFDYAKGAHNVVEVDKAGYDACSAANAIGTYTDGNTTVTLTSGAHYFLCSFPSHCTSGMKLAVTVGAGTTTPAPAPTTVGAPPPTPAASVPAPATSLAPTPTTTTPVPSPVTAAVPSAATPTPSPSPSPTSTPTPTPAPTPLSPSPASTISSPPPPPSASTPSATGAPPPSAAPSLLSSASLAAILLCVSAAFLAV